MSKLLFLCAFLISVTALNAQTRTVTGKVTDDKGAALSGVSVRAGNAGVNTDASGNYTLKVPTTVKTLTFSYVGFASVTKDITGNTVDVRLAPENAALTEVVVVGYGTQKRADVTGSVATVKAADIENKPFSSIDKALQGQVAGLQSVAASGQPGASQAILIRGVSSISAGNAPLWVIDGVPVNTGNASQLATTANLLSTLNPNDIESISVLKDAASQSIYGSRAANGVIIVTTKKGKTGRTVFRFDTEVGVNNIAYVNDKYRPLTAAEYVAITKEGLTNLGVSQATNDATIAGLGGTSGIDYNWYDAIVKKNAPQQQYNLSMSGGNEKTTFFISGGHFIQEGTTINSNMKRTNGNVNFQHKATDRLTIGLNLNGGVTNQRAPLNGGSFGNPVLASYFMLPTRSAYNTDGSYNFTNLGGLHNVVALTEIDKRFLRQSSFRGSLSGEYRILNNLKFRSQFGSDYNILEEDQYNNPLHGDGVASNGRSLSSYTRYFNYVWTNTLSLAQSLLKSGDLMLNAQLGYESQKSAGYISYLQNSQFPPTTALTYPASGASPITAFAQTSDYTFNSAFASANFNFKNKYVVSGSFRRDGSSRFGPKNRYGNFWAVGASWNIDKEAFMENVSAISQLKLRASYGVNGNAAIGNYDWAPSYNFGNNYNQQPGSSPGNVGDSSLTWELNKPLDFGIDISVLKNRINLTVDYYVRKSEDLLLGVQLSRTSGYTQTTRNTGAMENKGLEVTLNAIPVRTKNFDWTVDFNFATNKNTITSLPGGADILNGTQVHRQGEPITSWFVREYAGVDPANGDPLWYTDATQKTTTNVYPAASTRQIHGQSLPKYFGSLNNTINFKGFSLEAQLYYNYGNLVYDTWGSYQLASGFGATFNKVARVLDRWTTPGQVTDIPKYIYNGNKNFQSASSFYLQSGDFIRLRNVQLGYTFPKALVSKVKLSNVFFYVRGTNLFTWVKDKNLSFDPEQGTNSSTNLQVFIPKTLTAGLNIGF
jgi:TonB-dependent starch-binding outer membrane protein SusC